MSYRDDHDAAISRITALERELADAQQTSARDNRRIEMLEREIADMRRHEPAAPRRAPTNPPTARPPRAAPRVELPLHGPAVSGALLVVLGLLAALVVFVAIQVALAGDEPPPPNNCVVRSAPDHARVFGITETGREVDLGAAPVDLTFEAWQAYRSIQFRIPGHDTLTADAPHTRAQCAPDTYDLFR